MSENRPLPSRNRLIQLFDYDPVSGHLTWRVSRGSRGEAGTRAGHKRAGGYRQIKLDGIQYLEHRIVYRLCTGIDAGDFSIDHSNRTKDDNRIFNLRIATPAQQEANKCDIDGCDFLCQTNQFRSRIVVDGIEYHLGLWPTKEIARAVYATAAAKVRGEFAPDPPPNPFDFINTHWGKFSDGSHEGVGFCRTRGKWRARIKIDCKDNHLGYFTTKEEARQARLTAETELTATAACP